MQQMSREERARALISAMSVGWNHNHPPSAAWQQQVRQQQMQQQSEDEPSPPSRTTTEQENKQGGKAFAVRSQQQQQQEGKLTGKINNYKGSSSSSSRVEQAELLPSSRRRATTESQTNNNSKTTTTKAAAASVPPVIRFLQDHIPKDPTELRGTQLFQSTYQLLEWQRDRYVAGQEYADWRRKERQKNNEQQPRQQNPNSSSNNNNNNKSAGSNDLPYESTALGHQQFKRLAADFVPSTTVRSALLPIVVDLPQYPALYRPTRDATVDLILGQQHVFDQVVQRNLLWYLDDEQNRMSIKSSTQGYIATTYRDDSDRQQETTPPQPPRDE